MECRSRFLGTGSKMRLMTGQPVRLPHRYKHSTRGIRWVFVAASKSTGWHYSALRCTTHACRAHMYCKQPEEYLDPCVIQAEAWGNSGPAPNRVMPTAFAGVGRRQ